MAQFLLNKIYLLLLVATITSCFKYKCFRDICDSSWQFCNDGEERCNVCTPEQCTPDVADHIFNQCEQKCQILKPSTIPSTTEVSDVTTSAPSLLSQLSDGASFILEIIVVLCGLVLCLLAIGFVIIYKKISQVLARQTDIESGCSSSILYNTIEGGGEPEKRPLLESAPPLGDSDRHQNRVEDIHILAQATTNVTQASDPPSYTTRELNRETTPVKQVDSDQDNLLSEKLANTNFLPGNMQPADTEEITRPKNV